MSLLPQRKKSAEEINQLREALGIPGQGPAEEPAHAVPQPVAPPPPAAVPTVVVSAPAPPAVAPPVLDVEISGPPAHAHHGQAEEAGEPAAVLEVEISGPPPHHPHPEPETPASEVPRQRQVRSLRKSEQGPISAPHRPAAGSKLPIHRHSAGEIKEIRRQEGLAPHAAIPHPLTQTARWWLAGPGYAAALLGAVLVFIYSTHPLWPILCEGFALAVAGWIFARKPLSRHHAAFLVTLVLLVLVFGILHYFPNLRYGT